MNEAARIAAFGRALRQALSQFMAEESVVRSRQAAALQSGDLLTPFDDEMLLERPTRRFLIDPMLRALDWNPDDPSQVVEEARSWHENGGRLFFDYLGLSRGRAATLIIEAKGANSVTARAPREPSLSGPQMSVRISQALASLKGGGNPAILKQWGAWLTDLRTYVLSLSSIERATLTRVVITAGRWLIVFKNPSLAFIELGSPDPADIHCYISAEEIVTQHAEIYRLLARCRLTDALPLTMRLGEALPVLEPKTVTSAYRSVVVSTRTAGGVRSEFPLRTVYPALTLISGGRAFGVVDYDSDPLFEPRDAQLLTQFLIELNTKGDAFQQRVLVALNRTDIVMTASSLFPTEIREPEVAGTFTPEPGSTAAQAPVGPYRPQLVRHTGERGAEHEFLVITGLNWFYKMAPPTGSECDFHSFPIAKRRGFASEGRFTHAHDRFTLSNDPQNCQHEDHLGLRSLRCQVAQIESHLCCRTCAFHGVCWDDIEVKQLPCGK